MILSKETEFYLYGAGEQGENTYRKLQEKGIKIEYFLDQNAEKCGDIFRVPVYSPTPENLSKLRKDGVVIICLANGLLHKKVASSLFLAGYRYIVFLPIGLNVAEKEQMRLIALYNLAIRGSIEDEWVDEFGKYITYDFDVYRNVIKEDGENYTVFVRTDILHSISYEMVEGDKAKIISDEAYRDVPLFIHPYLELFRFYSGDARDPYVYFNTFKKKPSQSSWDEVIKERKNLYDLYKLEIQKGNNFFVESAPLVLWNKSNYFNLTEGHHRIVFLMSEERVMVPVRIRKRDFEKWINRDSFIPLVAFMKENNIQKLYAPISHPAFQDFPAIAEKYGKLRIQHIVETIGIDDIKGTSCLEYGRTQGYFSRCLGKAGIGQAIYYSEEGIERKITELIADLTYSSAISVTDRKDNLQNTDVVIIRTNDISDIAFFSKKAKKWLFIETSIGIEPMREVLEREGFRNLKTGIRDYVEGKEMIFYSFSR